MFWMTKKMPDKTAGYLLCTIRWGETRLTHEYYWGPDPKNRFKWWVSKEACQANLPDGGFEDPGYEIVAWARMPEPYRKEMYLREILPHLSGEMSKDTELLKETAKQGDIVVLNVKMPDGTPTTVSAAIKAKYPHVVHMQYQTANGYTVNKTLAWKKLLMIMLNPSSIEDNEEGE